MKIEKRVTIFVILIVEAALLFDEACNFPRNLKSRRSIPAFPRLSQ